MGVARVAVVALALAGLSRPVVAQSWRTVESTRQLHDSAAHTVRVHYAAGRVDISPTSAPVLYSMTLRYDEATVTPLHRYDAGGRVLTLGAESQSKHFTRGMDDQGKGEMRLALSRVVPMDLQLELGATKAMLDLGGLQLTGLRLESGASETVLDFSSPNQLKMGTLDVDVGAASFEARNLGNANASNVRVHGGVGSVELDFGGEWSQDMNVDVNLALGKLTLHLPRDVGVRMEVQKLFASFDQQGLRKRGDVYFSDNWDSARYRIRLRASTTFGGIELDRAE
jgi:hypothetical protein